VARIRLFQREAEGRFIRTIKPVLAWK